MYEKQEINIVEAGDRKIPITKPKKRYNITKVTSIPISGKLCLKIGCYETKYYRQLFVHEALNNLPKDYYLTFMSKHVTSQEEFDKFKNKLEFCNQPLKI